MKKFYYLFVVMALSLFAGLQARADEVTGTFVDLAGNPASNSVSFDGQTFSLNDDISITFSKGTGSTKPQYYVSGAAVRFYGGNTLTFNGVENVTITKIEFEVPSSNALNSTNVTFSNGTCSGTVWTGSTNEVVMTNPAASGNVRFTAVTITYTKGGSEPVDPPTPALPDFYVYENAASTTASGQMTLNEETKVYTYNTLASTGEIVISTATGTQAEIEAGAIALAAGQTMELNKALTWEAKAAGKFTMPAAGKYNIVINYEAKTITFAKELPSLTISEELDEVSMGLNGTSTYADYNNIKIGSSAVYYAQCANSYHSIQLRSSGNNSGVVTTASGGIIDKIVVEWNSNTADARTLNVYGSNTAYTAPSDLFNTSKAGSLVAELKRSEAADGVSEFAFTEPYAFFGFRSAGSAMYINKVTVKWRAQIVDGLLPGQPVFSVPSSRVLKGTAVELSSPFDEEVEIYYTTDGTEPTKASTKYTAPIVIDNDMTIKAIIAYEDYTTAVASASYTIMPEYTTLAEVSKLENKATFVFAAPLTVVYTAESYNYVYDGATYGMLYKSNLGLAAGDSIAPRFEAMLSIYNGLVEIVPTSDLTVLGKAKSMPEPTVIAGENVKAALTADKMNAWLTLEEIRISEPTPANNGNFYGYYEGAEGNDTIAFRNNFKLASMPAAKYNITGFVAVYKNDVQFYPSAYQECTFDVKFGNVISPATLGVEGADYKEYTAEYADGMAYKANVAGEYGALVLRSTEGSGIVATVSDVPASAVTVYWNDSTKQNLVFDVYGNSEPYASASDLIYATMQGHYLGSLKAAQAVNGVSVLPLAGDYPYVGFRVNNGTAYIDSIKVEYSITLHEGDVLPYNPVISLASGYVKVGTKVEISSPIDGPSIYYTTDGTTPTAASTLYTKPVVIDGSMDLKAVLAYGGYMSEVVSAEYTPMVSTLAEAAALADGAEFMMDADLTVVYAYGKEPQNAYVYDGANYGLLTADMVAKAGSVVSKGWTGTIAGNCHMTADSVELAAEAGTVPEPEVFEFYVADSLSVNDYVLIKAVTFMDETPGEAEAFTGLDDKDKEVSFYNMFEIDREAAGTYDVTGFVGVDEEGDLVVYPVRMAKPAGIADIDAEDAEAVYYNLQGIRVANPEKGRIYIRVAGSSSQKVLVK